MLDDYSRDLRLAKRASTVILRSSKLLTRMSVKGHKRTWPHVRSMSALPPKADIPRGVRALALTNDTVWRG